MNENHEMNYDYEMNDDYETNNDNEINDQMTKQDKRWNVIKYEVLPQGSTDKIITEIGNKGT